MTEEQVEDSIENQYHINRWGNGYFSINDSGNLTVRPNKGHDKAEIVIKDVVKEITEQGINLPVVIRFHDILRSQVAELYKSFAGIIKEAEYQGNYIGVYPVKVNQMREVVEEILDAGADYNWGLEAGSKTELLAVLATNENINALTILNGYKDEDYLRLALLGRKLGRKVIVVIEKFSELAKLIEMSIEMDVEPILGIRAKVSIEGSGKWSESGGEKAKFGLTVSEILNAVELLKTRGFSKCLKLLHFHIGSQVTNIQTIKDAVSEGARIYSELFKMGVPLEYIDVGGGLGVDYDGSQSTHNSSRNYSTEIYAGDVVYGIKKVCDIENVPHPDIVSESGRFVTAHHSCLITEVIGKVDITTSEYLGPPLQEEHVLLQNIKEIYDNMNSEDKREVFNDALSVKNDMESAFKLGVLSLKEKAVIETYFWKICKLLRKRVKHLDFVPEDFKNFSENLCSQYLCNFSIFQSLPDTWAIDQLIPIVPITRLNEVPTEECTLVDITCDSDGKIDNFIDAGQVKKTIKLHELKETEKYYIGLFMTGAYQDVMGDMHNLFGRVNEVHVYHDEEDPTDFYVEEVIRGWSANHILKTMQYNPEQMAYTIKKSLDRLASEKKLQARESVRLIDFYEECLNGYTYLK